MIGNVTFPGISQCHALNRPPSPAPYSRDGSGTQLNFNKTLRNEQAWNNRAKFVFSPVGYRAAVYQRLYQNLRTDGIYDVKSSVSPWDGNADFGNFLYGSLMHIYGFSEDEALRFSAAYQAIQDHGSKFTMASIPHGIFNFLTNTGDGEGDPGMVLRGYNYAKEVYATNPQAVESLTCVDQKTLQSSGGISDSGGNDGNAPGGGAGGALWVTCELWYFSSGLTNGQFYLEKNCKFFLIP